MYGMSVIQKLIPEKDVREIYITQEAWEKAGTEQALREKLERIGYETVSSEVF